MAPTTPATLQTPLHTGNSEQQPSTEPQLSRLLSHPNTTLLWDRGVRGTGNLLPPSRAVDKASAPHRHRESTWPELGLEGEKAGGEDSLGTQSQLPVVGAHPLARPAAKNRVGHGTGLGGEAGLNQPVGSKHQH